jgi:hypothetical protein
MGPALIWRSHSLAAFAVLRSASITMSPEFICKPMLLRWLGERTLGATLTATNSRCWLALWQPLQSRNNGADTGSVEPYFKDPEGAPPPPYFGWVWYIMPQENFGPGDIVVGFSTRKKPSHPKRAELLDSGFPVSSRDKPGTKANPPRKLGGLRRTLATRKIIEANHQFNQNRPPRRRQGRDLNPRWGRRPPVFQAGPFDRSGTLS